ncbi:MAG TPA: sugar ABC transporter ATP-binding protein [Streptosporangiaceae bacterium]|nr:sugar ABC transporter ATP-binding protein [Streptosporangiaceae bacterium]
MRDAGAEAAEPGLDQSPGPVLLDASHFTKSFGSTRALVHGDLLVRAGEIHALVGHNGSGKSTFIRTLAGYHDPDAGRLTVRDQDVPLPIRPGGSASLGLAFIHQDLGLIDSLSVLENMCLTRLATCRVTPLIQWRRERLAAERDLRQLGAELPLDKPVGSLRQVDRALVATARAFAALGNEAGRVLFCDELTGYLAKKEVAELYGAMRQLTARGDAVVLVSHDLTEVLELADVVTVLRNGATIATRRTSDISLDELSSLLVGESVTAPQLAEAQVAPASQAGAVAGQPLRVTGLTAERVNEVAFEVAPGEIVGLTGLVGSGHEETVEVLAGARPAIVGSVSVGAETWQLPGLTTRGAMRRGVGWVPPDRLAQGLIGSLPAQENLPMLVLSRFFRHGLIRWPEVRRHTRETAVALTVSPPDPRLAVQALSGGNQQKQLLGKVLELSPRLLLLSEPTRGVDVAARSVLWRLVQAGAPRRYTVWTSTDFDELASVCDRVIVFSRGRVSVQLSRESLSVEAIARACLVA